MCKRCVHASPSLARSSPNYATGHRDQRDFVTPPMPGLQLRGPAAGRYWSRRSEPFQCPCWVGDEEVVSSCENYQDLSILFEGIFPIGPELVAYQPRSFSLKPPFEKGDAERMCSIQVLSAA